MPKGRGKAKAKAKAKVGRPHIEGSGEALESQGAIVILHNAQAKAKFKTSTSALRAKALAEVETKGIEQLIADARTELQLADSKIEEAVALQHLQIESVQEARHGFEAAKAEVESALELEVQAARQCHQAMTDRKTFIESRVEDAELMGLRNKITMLEVMAGALRMRKLVVQAQSSAAAAAVEAKRARKAQQQDEKDATKNFALAARGNPMDEGLSKKMVLRKMEDEVTEFDPLHKRARSEEKLEELHKVDNLSQTVAQACADVQIGSQEVTDVSDDSLQKGFQKGFQHEDTASEKTPFGQDEIELPLTMASGGC